MKKTLILAIVFCMAPAALSYCVVSPPWDNYINPLGREMTQQAGNITYQQMNTLNKLTVDFEGAAFIPPGDPSPLPDYLDCLIWNVMYGDPVNLKVNFRHGNPPSRYGLRVFDFPDGAGSGSKVLTANSIGGGAVFTIKDYYDNNDVLLAGFGLVFGELSSDVIVELYSADDTLITSSTLTPNDGDTGFSFYGYKGNVREIFEVRLSTSSYLLLDDMTFVLESMPLTYHVDVNNGNDLNEGLSKEDAFATIQKGITTAEDGGTLLVWPGVYNECINFAGKAITVESADDPAVIQGSDCNAVTFDSGEQYDSVLKNFIITGSDTAVFLDNSSPTLTNLTIVDNSSGIYCIGSSNPDVSSCILFDNANVNLFQCNAKYSCIEEKNTIDPLAHWNLDEGQGTDANDSAGSNHGTLVGGPSWVAGQTGDWALDFDGINDCVLVADSDTLDISTDDITLSLWIKPGDLTDGGIIGKYDNWGEYNYAIWYKSGSLHFQIGNSGDSPNNPNPFETRVSTSAVNMSGQWYHIVGVYDYSQLKLYVNGTEVDSVNENRDPGIGVGPLCIGNIRYDGFDWHGHNETNEYFRGLIDDIMIYDTALTAEQVQLLYDDEAIYINSVDPLFADSDNGDYHLRSQRGRYWPQHDVWVLDEVTSPCIDSGDPTSDIGAEHAPNGGRINCGAYGGTKFASMSNRLLEGDIDGNGTVDFRDFSKMAANWLETLP